MRLPGMGSTGPVRSSRYQALKQMLVTLTRLDKLAAACHGFKVRGMTTRTTSSYPARVAAGFQPQVTTATTAAAVEAEADDDGVVHGARSLSDVEVAVTPQRGYPRFLLALASHIKQPSLPLLLGRFLHAEVHGPLPEDASLPSLDDCPAFEGRINRFYQGVVTGKCRDTG
ncbi:hypothetical protein C8R45DRAFT_1102708 [Mycena sanguinolenta]|nr:hypothetical protein C8R45DRAFT_1102708 [Mycena sanguinolenta]